MTVFCDYLRLVSYLAVVCISIFGIRRKTEHFTLLLMGNILMSAGLALSVFHVYIIERNSEFFRIVILTPLSFLWAALHFVVISKDIKNGGVK